MILCDEQMAAVCGGQQSEEWEPVERPVGPQPLPDWLCGAHIDWMNGCSNAPHILLKVRTDPYRWPDMRFEKVGASAYIARNDDGRARVHYHDGAVSDGAAWRVFAGDKPFTYQWKVPDKQYNEAWQEAAQRAGQKHLDWCMQGKHEAKLFTGEVVDRATLRLEVKTLQITTQQAGYGGDGYLITMLDGTERMLRGPWHGGAPKGLVEVSTVDMSYDFNTEPRNRGRHSKPWHRRSACGGLYITEDLFLRAMARYCPHAGIARVTRSYGVRLEMYREEWCMPKAAIYELERMRDQKREPAGQFWRVYWDGRGIYCGQLRIPKHGFRPEVTDLPGAA